MMEAGGKVTSANTLVKGLNLVGKVDRSDVHIILHIELTRRRRGAANIGCLHILSKHSYDYLRTWGLTRHIILTCKPRRERPDVRHFDACDGELQTPAASGMEG